MTSASDRDREGSDEVGDRFRVGLGRRVESLEQAGYPGSAGFILSRRHQLGDAKGRRRE